MYLCTRVRLSSAQLGRDPRGLTLEIRSRPRRFSEFRDVLVVSDIDGIFLLDLVFTTLVVVVL